MTETLLLYKYVLHTNVKLYEQVKAWHEDAALEMPNRDYGVRLPTG
jgi:hypothetical protein